VTTANDVYASDATAAAVLTGLYTNLSSSDFTSTDFRNLSMYAGLSADELTLWNGTSIVWQNQYYTNALSANMSGAAFIPWNSVYPYIFTCNSAIEGLSSADKLSAAARSQLLGEAKFMRAFFYFYLVNLYGDVPLILGTDYKVNALMGRTSKDKVYTQIVNDLLDAKKLLDSTGYVQSDCITVYEPSVAERVRPNSWVASALLARVYLYMNDYPNAEEQSSILINNTNVYGLESIGNAFLRNNSEAIWQLQPVNVGWNTEDAKLFIIPPTGLSTSNPVYLSDTLLNSFEVGDLRKSNWIGNYTDVTGTYHYAYKYKDANLGDPVIEYHMVLRLAEQYLIRAEARAQQGNLSGSQDDLNTIRTRAGLTSTSANDKKSLLVAILHERQVELFTEWGHRWLDLKRTGQIGAVMSAVAPKKQGKWDSNWALYPIPVDDINKDPLLIQNQGY